MSDIWVIAWVIFFISMICIAEKEHVEVPKNQGDFCKDFVKHVLVKTDVPFFTAKIPPALATVIFFNNEKTQNFVLSDITFRKVYFRQY